MFPFKADAGDERWNELVEKGALNLTDGIDPAELDHEVDTEPIPQRRRVPCLRESASIPANLGASEIRRVVAIAVLDVCNDTEAETPNGPLCQLSRLSKPS